MGGERPSFLHEARRRGVFGALVAYVVAAAGGLQLGDVVSHALEWPPWVMKALLVVAALGLPVTLVVSWFYNLTRHGLVLSEAPPARKPKRSGAADHPRGDAAAEQPSAPELAPAPRPSPPATPVRQPAGARPDPRSFEPGGLLAGRYQLLRELARGGSGRVLAAKDTKLSREVAVKVLTDAFEPHKVARFETEARAAGSLLHPNVLGIYDVGEHGGVPFLVCELLQGHTLKKELLQGRLALAAALGWALQLARGLSAAHQKGVVHRDLKPENLFLTSGGVLKILDFGLAKLAEDDAGLGLTPTGAIFGTPGYLSPEQARGEPADARADVFAAGAVLYEMLSGVRAFAGNTLIEAGVSALTLQPAPLPRDVPPGLVEVVRRALQKDPARRFANAGELLLALEAFAQQGQPGVSNPGQRRPAPTPGGAAAQPVRVPGPAQRSAPGTPPPAQRSNAGAPPARPAEGTPRQSPPTPNRGATPQPEQATPRPAQARPLIDPDALAVNLRKARLKQMESGVALDQDDEFPFLRCGSCEADSHRSASTCALCGEKLDTEEQRAYNRAYWEKRRAEESAPAVEAEGE
jgi:serine/threonine protein kinase